MNSANNEAMNRTRKIQNDHAPRLCRRKLSRRRWFIGESQGRRSRLAGAFACSGPGGSTLSWPGLTRPSTTASASRSVMRTPSLRLPIDQAQSRGWPGPARPRGVCGDSSPPSHLSRFEIDTRIDPGVGEVGNQVHHESEERENIEIREHHRVVALNERIVGEIAEAV